MKGTWRGGWGWGWGWGGRSGSHHRPTDPAAGWPHDDSDEVDSSEAFNTVLVILSRLVVMFVTGRESRSLVLAVGKEVEELSACCSKQTPLSLLSTFNFLHTGSAASESSVLPFKSLPRKPAAPELSREVSGSNARLLPPATQVVAALLPTTH